VRARSTACHIESPPTVPHSELLPRTLGHCPPTTTGIEPTLSGQPVLRPALIIVCVIMAITAGLIYRLTALGSLWTVPGAAIRAAVQLAAIASVLAAALTRLWSSMLVLAVMFVVASLTAARRSQASCGSALLTVSLALGLLAVLPLLLLSGVEPLTGVAVVPIVAIVLGSTMTAVAVAAPVGVGHPQAARCGGRSGAEPRYERT